jgi:hypothetical protein
MSDLLRRIRFGAVLLTIGIPALFINSAMGYEANGSISGRVLDDVDGAGISAVAIRAYDESWKYLKSGYANSSGIYSITGLASGNYYLISYNNSGYVDEYYNDASSRSAATAVPVLSGGITAGIDFNLALGGVISGKVTRDSDGAAISGANVIAFSGDSNSYRYAYTDLSGNYNITGLSAGYYNVYVASYSNFIGEYYDNAFSLSSATLIPVIPGETIPNINISMATGGTISGRVNDQTTGLGIPSVNVQVYDILGNWINSEYTDSSGNYTITALVPGSYYVSAAGESDSNYALQYYDNALSIDNATRVRVAQDETAANINFTLGSGRTIMGRVTGKANGEAIQNIWVIAQKSPGSPTFTATTDASGNYQIRNVSAGTYLIHTSNNKGYINEYYKDAGGDWGAQPVFVSKEEDATGIDFTLAMGGAITGRVVRHSDQTGIAGAYIYASGIDVNSESAGYTDSSGYYQINDLAPGDYYVQVDASGYVGKYYGDSSSRKYSTIVTVVQGSVTQHIDFDVITGGAISGRVVKDSDGTGIANIMVSAYDINWNSTHNAITAYGFGKSAWTDSMGGFTINGLEPGNYCLATVNAPGYIDEYYPKHVTLDGAAVIIVNQNSVTDNINFRLSTGSAISGKVTFDSDGTAISGVTINVYDTDWNQVKTVNTDFAGYYRAAGLAPGSYYVATYETRGFIDEYYPNAADWRFAQTVYVNQSLDKVDIDFGMSAGFAIDCAVASKSSGFGVPGVIVEAYNSNWELVSSDIAKSGGYCSLEGLTAGNYYLRTSNNLGYVDEYSHMAYSPDEATPLSLIEDYRLVIFNLAEGGGSVSGRIVRATDSAGLSGAAVHAYDTSWNYIKTGVADSAGNYSIEGLVPGNYYLRTTNNSGFIDEYYDDVLSRGAAIPVTVLQGQVAGSKNFSLALGGSISGMVRRNSDGVGISNVTVEAYDRYWNTRIAVPTDLSGNYMIPGLASGSYYLRAYAPSGMLAEYYSNSSSLEAAIAIDVIQGADVPGKDFNLLSDGSISGRVTESSGGAGIDNVLVQVYDCAWNYIKSVLTNSNGYYSVVDLPAGNYYLHTSNGSSYIDTYYGGGSSNYTRLGAVSVSVTRAHDTANINFTLIQGSGTISGTIINGSNGEGISGITVVVCQSSGSSYIVATAITDVAGKFSITGLAPGEYYLKSINSLGYVDEQFVGGVSVAAGSVTGIGSFGLYKETQGPDFNGDHKPDILLRNAATGEIYVWFMDGAIRLGGGAIQTVPDQNWKIVGTADFDYDKKSDILWRNSSTGENAVWYMNNLAVIGGDGIPTVSDPNWRIAGTGDFNRDGKVDLLWRNVATGENAVWYMDRVSVIKGEAIPTVDPNWMITGAADFNGDGNVDILWRNSTTGENTVWFMNGATVVGGASIAPMQNLDWKIVRINDFNRDGNPDILWHNMSTGDNLVWYMHGVECIGQTSLENAGGRNWLIFDNGGKARGADFDNDGNEDLLWRNTNTGEILLWQMQGASRLGNAVLIGTVADLNWKIAGLIDFNDDGRSDILLRNASTGENAVWYMNGSRVTRVDSIPTVDPEWQIAGVGDFNTDGKPDILWRKAYTGENAVWYMNGAMVIGGGSIPAVTDQDWQIVTAADFNNDGTTDILWQNLLTGVNCIWYMNGVTVTGAAAIPSAGVNWTITGTGDFNKDGKLDVLWRNTATGENAVWYMNGAFVIGGGSLAMMSGQEWTMMSQGGSTSIAAGRPKLRTLPVAEAAATDTITAFGGTLSASANGVTYRLTIPRGALPRSTTVTMTPVTVTSPTFPGGQPAAVRLEPEGLRLYAPAVLTIETTSPFTGNILGFTAESSGTAFHAYPAQSPEGSVIQFNLMHFSHFGAGTAAWSDFGWKGISDLSPEAIAEQVDAMGIQVLTEPFLYWYNGPKGETLTSLLKKAQQGDGSTLDRLIEQMQAWSDQMADANVWDVELTSPVSCGTGMCEYLFEVENYLREQIASLLITAITRANQSCIDNGGNDSEVMHWLAIARTLLDGVYENYFDLNALLALKTCGLVGLRIDYQHSAVAMGDNADLEAVGIDNRANALNPGPIIWASFNAAMASIASSGPTSAMVKGVMSKISADPAKMFDTVDITAFTDDLLFQGSVDITVTPHYHGSMKTLGTRTDSWLNKDSNGSPWINMCIFQREANHEADINIPLNRYSRLVIIKGTYTETLVSAGDPIQCGQPSSGSYYWRIPITSLSGDKFSGEHTTKDSGDVEEGKSWDGPWSLSSKESVSGAINGPDADILFEDNWTYEKTFSDPQNLTKSMVSTISNRGLSWLAPASEPAP